MPCDHKGAPDLIAMAEALLLCSDIDRATWPGMRFRWSENLDGGMWASVIIEIEWRGDQWIVTRLDRNKEPVSEIGFEQL